MLGEPGQAGPPCKAKKQAARRCSAPPRALARDARRRHPPARWALLSPLDEHDRRHGDCMRGERRGRRGRGGGVGRGGERLGTSRGRAEGTGRRRGGLHAARSCRARALGGPTHSRTVSIMGQMGVTMGPHQPTVKAGKPAAGARSGRRRRRAGERGRAPAARLTPHPRWGARGWHTQAGTAGATGTSAGSTRQEQVGAACAAQRGAACAACAPESTLPRGVILGSSSGRYRSQMFMNLWGFN